MTQPRITSCYKSVNNRTISVATNSDPQQPWLAAAMNFDTFTEDLAVLSSLLSFITIYFIYIDVNIANIWRISLFMEYEYINS